MNPLVQFLTTLGQALATQSLYGDGHPVRLAARDRVFAILQRLLTDRGTLRLSFLDGSVVVGSRVLAELKGWEWGERLAQAGVQRLEIDSVPVVQPDDVELLLAELHTRLVSPGAPAVAVAMRGFRFGPLGVAGGEDVHERAATELFDAMAQLPMTEESSAVRWIHDEIATGGRIPMAEVEAVVHSLAMAMHREQHLVMPLLDIKTYDQYTTVHSCNVAMLSIGLAEQLGLPARDAHAIGTAALLHDIGKVRVPAEVLVKPGRLTAAEVALMRTHPVEGARILGQRGRGNGLAVAVAYEHHLWDNGRGGYPQLRWPRRSHYASRLVHVCDLYDALSTRRPYRDACTPDRALTVLRDAAGVEVDAEMVEAFSRMLSHSEVSRTATTEETPTSGWSADISETARQMQQEFSSSLRTDAPDTAVQTAG